MRIEDNQIIADEGKYLYRKGSDIAFTKGFLLPNETEADFEELAEKKPEPKPTDNYDERVNSLIRELYSESQEFAILRQKDEKPDEYKAYYDYCEQCKADAKRATR